MIFKKLMCGGVKTPPYNAKETGNEPGTPRVEDGYGPHACGPYEPAGNGR